MGFDPVWIQAAFADCFFQVFGASAGGKAKKAKGVICGLGEFGVFDSIEFIEKSVKEIRKTVGDNKVISACSGGVDSTVAAVLVPKIFFCKFF